MELHPDVEPLATLLGTWVGEGEGEYPTIEPFRYREEVVFGHVGKPFLTYRQATTNLATGLPAHAETGYLRVLPEGRIELVLAHPTGVTELAEGSVEAEPGPGSAGTAASAGEPHSLILHLVSTAVGCTATAKEITSVERHIHLAGDVLRYDLAMGAVGQPHQPHLRATLQRR